MEVQNLLNNKQGWLVTVSATGVNIALGTLYSWSIIASFLRENQGWSAIETQIPYMIACGVFALLMIPGGRIQDKIGPKFVIMASGIFAGIGLIASSYFLTVVGLSICFGLLFGTAIGLGYSSATPPAVKWFGANKRGLIAGIVVSGFGIASVIMAPATTYLISSFGISSTFFILGITFFIIVTILSQFVKNPPQNYMLTVEANNKQRNNNPKSSPIEKVADYEWFEMLKTSSFYIIWFMFCFGSLAGLMIIGQLSSIVEEQSGMALGFLLVALLAIFNAGGRIIGGVMSDKLGRNNSLRTIFIFQAVNFLVFGYLTGLAPLIAATAVAGFCYGACLSIFPAITADLFGTKNLGVNYGFVFTSWGAGGVFGGMLGGIARDLTGTYLTAFIIAAVLCLVGLCLTFILKPVSQKEKAAAVKPTLSES